jgi:hypothetical protein
MTRKVLSFVLLALLPALSARAAARLPEVTRYSVKRAASRAARGKGVKIKPGAFSLGEERVAADSSGLILLNRILEVPASGTGARGEKVEVTVPVHQDATGLKWDIAYTILTEDIEVTIHPPEGGQAGRAARP